MNQNWQIFIKNKQKNYKEIKPISCPAFNGEQVYFNERGFNHLIMKSGKFRTKSEQIRRLNLFSKAPKIISECKNISKNYKTNKNGKIGFFWTLTHKMEHKLVIVVIRQIGESGQKHFFSIMDKTPKSAQTP